MEHIAQKPKEYTAFEFRPGPSPGPSWAKPWQPASQSFKKLVSKTQCWCDRLTDHPFTWATVWCFLGQALATWHPKLQKIHLLAHVTVRPLARRATVLQKHVLPKSRDYPTFEPCEVLLELVYIPISLSLEGNLSMEHIVHKPKEYMAFELCACQQKQAAPLELSAHKRSLALRRTVLPARSACGTSQASAFVADSMAWPTTGKFSTHHYLGLLQLKTFGPTTCPCLSAESYKPFFCLSGASLALAEVVALPCLSRSVGSS